MRWMVVVAVILPVASWGQGFTKAQICDSTDACASTVAVGSSRGLIVSPGSIPPGATAISCKVDTQTALTQCQAAPGTGVSIYITDVVFSNHAGAQNLSLAYGTGTNCATGETAVSPVMAFGANSGAVISFKTPVQVTSAKALCCKPSGGTAFSCWISGYTK